MKIVKLLIAIDMRLKYHVIAMKNNPELSKAEQSFLQNWAINTRFETECDINPNNSIDKARADELRGTICRIDVIIEDEAIILNRNTITPKLDIKKEDLW